MSCGWCHEGRCTMPVTCERIWRQEIPADPWPPESPDPEPENLPPIPYLTCPDCGGQIEGCPMCAELERLEATP